MKITFSLLEQVHWLLECMARTCGLNGFYTFCVCLGPYHVNFIIEE